MILNPEHEQIIESGASYQEIIHYLLTISESVQGSTYNGGKWQIILQNHEHVSLGSLKLHRTTLVFRGDPDAVTFQVQAFRMRFLSAGG
ncbi:hypothetical protein [Anoxynatronum buryatiense]|uniref:Molybdopterin cofactor biosynthesis MoaD-related C-terminal domain-containing protein n=1 Tax=Anoxynatronum buryatiense TaxID=489973 RepID=A0AA45WTY4_9CLOT|nr:hypothetical protein [Anoxynatronum buryatiense]SMP44629.1 hypothetical protein SAMN06296020_102209 [Anoxynatronum buryatiense]